MTRSRVSILVLMLLLSGCGMLGPTREVEVRVRNGSGTILDRVSLFLPRETLTFSTLAPGQESPYKEVARAFDIVSVQVVVGQDSASLQVVDYVGEDPLEPGRYTYVLRVLSTDPLGIGMDFEKGS